MANPVVHVELNTSDLSKAKDFYGTMFGWQFMDMDMGPTGIYSTFKTDGGPAGGMCSMPDGQKGWLNYIGVDDIKAATEKATSLGAKVFVANQEIPNVGWMSIMSDPTGCTIAIFQPAPGSQANLNAA